MTIQSSRTGRTQKSTGMKDPENVPLSLLSQARIAAALMLCTWLVTFFLCRNLVQENPVALLALLPGLTVAVYLSRQLLIHLDANHRVGESDRSYPTLGAATWITLLRAVALVALAGFLPLAARPPHALPPALLWAPGLVYLGIALADLLDGYVARMEHRETELGKRLDIETDAAGMLVAVLVAVSFGRLPLLSLLVGLAYYFFIFGIWWRRKRHLPLIALQSRPYARIIAGFQMGLVAMAMLPIFNPTFTFLVAYMVMTLLLAGFARDWLVVSCRVHCDRDQQTILDLMARRVCTQLLPLALRLIILTVGAGVLGTNISPTRSCWQWAQILCALLAGAGCLGRSAALLLTLLLSLNISPFGTSAATLALLGTSAALMLSGTGPWSLWSPEERVLYRRDQDGSLAGGENP
jgi:CDP-diacylglycerol--glycerol-3-phosphate 3-phosphatidyltransferase